MAKLYKEYHGGKIEVNYSAKNVRKAKEYIFFSHNLVVPPAVVIEEVQRNATNEPIAV